MKNLFGQIPNNFVGQLIILSLSYQPHKFRERLGQIILVVKKVDDFGGVLVQHILNLIPVLRHAFLHHVEQTLFNFLIFYIVLIFEHVKTCLDKQIYKVLIDFVVWEKSMYV